MLPIILSIIILALFIYKLFFFNWHPSLPKHFDHLNFFYYGHRGAPIVTPENTLLSFETAINNKLDGVELDVQLSKDNQMIVYHDRLINYNNKNVAITSLNLSDIKTIDVKNQFDNLDFQPIPTLEEVIHLLPSNMILNIEIKSYGWNNSKIIGKIIDLTTKKAINNQIIISSFDPFIIRKVKRINPLISTAFIWSNKSYYHYKIFSSYAKPDAFHINIDDVNKHITTWFNKKNIKIYAYTVNTKSVLDKAKKYNLNGVFTDNPEIKNV